MSDTNEDKDIDIDSVTDTSGHNPRKLGHPTSQLAWNFQPDHCRVQICSSYNLIEAIWWRKAYGCPQLTEGGRVAGCIDTLRLDDGAGCQIGFADQYDELRWVNVRYSKGQLWCGRGEMPAQSLMWDVARGWRGNVLGGYAAPFGLSFGEAYGEQARRWAECVRRIDEMEASWIRHAAETERPRLVRPYLGTVRKHGIEQDGRPCEACGSTETWMSGHGYRNTIGYDAWFCSACDSWLEQPSRCDNFADEDESLPDRPSQVPYDEAVAHLVRLPGEEPAELS